MKDVESINTSTRSHAYMPYRLRESVNAFCYLMLICDPSRSVKSHYLPLYLFFMCVHQFRYECLKLKVVRLHLSGDQILLQKYIT